MHNGRNIAVFNHLTVTEITGYNDTSLNVKQAAITVKDCISICTNTTAYEHKHTHSSLSLSLGFQKWTSKSLTKLSRASHLCVLHTFMLESIFHTMLSNTTGCAMITLMHAQKTWQPLIRQTNTYKYTHKTRNTAQSAYFCCASVRFLCLSAKQWLKVILQSV